MWKRSVSQVEKSAQRISLVHMSMHNRADYDVPVKALVKEVAED